MSPSGQRSSIIEVDGETSVACLRPGLRPNPPHEGNATKPSLKGVSPFRVERGVSIPSSHA